MTSEHPSLFQFLRPLAGTGFAPPQGGTRGRWFRWKYLQIEVHPSWWRIGLSFKPGVTFGVYLGPFVLAFGRTQLRWKTYPRTTTGNAGDAWQDYSFTITRAGTDERA